MIEIPLSSVIIQNQPNSDENESQNPQNESTDEPTMIGLGPLRTANKLWIKQRVRASDILSNLTGCEVNLILFFLTARTTKGPHKSLVLLSPVHHGMP